MVTLAKNYRPSVFGKINREWANKLGWKFKFNKIKEVLNIPFLFPDPVEFAQAIGEWQSIHPPLKVDGLLGPRTWKKMRSYTEYTSSSRTQSPPWLRLNNYTRIFYNVPLKYQGKKNPICFLVCMDMIMTFKNRKHNKRTLFFNYDPTISSIEYWNSFGRQPWEFRTVKIAESFGFKFIEIPQFNIDEEYLANLLRTKGPLILSIHVADLYAGKYGTPEDPDPKHAVVITGIDTEKDLVYINNPWKTKNILTINSVLKAIERSAQKAIERGETSYPPLAFLE